MARAAAGLAAATLLAGCQDFWNSLASSGPAPTGVSASDGSYANSVEVSWAAPDLSAEEWNEYEVDGYTVYWTGPTSGSGSTSSTSYSISVSPENRAEYYEVWVEATLTGGSAGTKYGKSSTDEGFAMYAPALSWIDGVGADYVEGDGLIDGVAWYETMLQRSFQYKFDFAAGYTGSVEFYPFGSLELADATGIGQAPVWECDEGGAGHKFYVKVAGSSGSSLSFHALCDNGYGF